MRDLATDSHVLIITNEDDIHVDAVVAELDELGALCTRLNTERFYQSISASYSVRPRGHEAGFLVATNQKKASISDISAVWYRLRFPPELPDEVSPGSKHILKQEKDAFLWGFYGIADCLWVSHPYDLRRASWKISQLTLARMLGFDVPDTIVSNCADNLLSFARKLKAPLCVKSLHERTTFIETPSGSFKIVPKVLSVDELESSLRNAGPMLLQVQRYIDKIHDLRVTVIGRKIFAIVIHSQAKPSAVVDWRDDSMELGHSTIELPIEMKRKLLSYMKYFKLNYGAFDFALGKDNKYYFLECNPNGQWLWLQLKTGQPMVAEMAKLLSGRARPLIPRSIRLPSSS